jgi:hypothetical protein
MSVKLLTKLIVVEEKKTMAAVAPTCFISASLRVSGPRYGIWGGPPLGNSGPPSALNRISNDQNVNDVFAGEALE